MQDQVGLLRGGEVIGADIDAPLCGAGDCLFSVRDGGVDLVRGEEVLLEKGLKQNSAHFARAENGYVQVGQLRGNCGGLNGYLRHGVPSE